MLDAVYASSNKGNIIYRLIAKRFNVTKVQTRWPTGAFLSGLCMERMDRLTDCINCQHTRPLGLSMVLLTQLCLLPICFVHVWSSLFISILLDYILLICRVSLLDSVVSS